MKIAFIHSLMNEGKTNHKLVGIINDLGVDVRTFDLREDVSIEDIAESPLAINRVFPTASLRGNNSMSKVLDISHELEERGIRVVNPTLAALCDYNRQIQMEVLKNKGIHVPDTYLVSSYEEMYALVRSLNIPVMLKPNSGGGAKEVTFIENPDNIPKPGDVNFETIPYVIQEYIANDGYIWRVNVLGDKIHYAAKKDVNGGIASACRGSTYQQVDEKPKVLLDSAMRAMEACNMDYGGFDVVEELGTGDFHFIDVNPTCTYSVGGGYQAMLGHDPVTKLAEFLISLYPEGE